MKAVLVIDMPRNCDDCVFFDEIADPFGTHDGEPECNAPARRHISYSDLVQFKKKERPDFCPLREMPERMKTGGIYKGGWNDAIEAIEGSGEDGE